MATPQASYYRYDPSFPAAVTAAVLFTVAFAAMLIQSLRYRSWVWTVMVVASAMEAFGFICRSISVKHVTEKPIYTAGFALIVLAPVLMAAACYIVFGRIVFHVVPARARTLKLLWISPRWQTLIFVLIDIVALLLQLGGALIITSVDANDSQAQSMYNKGRSIAQIGVVIQLAGFGLFSILAVRFNFTSKRFIADFDERLASSDGSPALGKRNGQEYFVVEDVPRLLKKDWQTILLVTNISSAAILIRSIYRMVDFTENRDGYTKTHEWPLYVFDSLMILIVVSGFAWFHPGKYLPYMGFRLPKHAR